MSVPIVLDEEMSISSTPASKTTVKKVKKASSFSVLSSSAKNSKEKKSRKMILIDTDIRDTYFGNFQRCMQYSDPAQRKENLKVFYRDLLKKETRKQIEFLSPLSKIMRDAGEDKAFKRILLEQNSFKIPLVFAVPCMVTTSRKVNCKYKAHPSFATTPISIHSFVCNTHQRKIEEGFQYQSTAEAFVQSDKEPRILKTVVVQPLNIDAFKQVWEIEDADFGKDYDSDGHLKSFLREEPVSKKKAESSSESEDDDDDDEDEEGEKWDDATRWGTMTTELFKQEFEYVRKEQIPIQMNTGKHASSERSSLMFKIEAPLTEEQKTTL